MKLRSFFALMLSVSMLFACSESSDDVEDPEDTTTTTTVTATGVSLDQTSVTMEIGDSYTLVATLEPSGAEGTISWISSNTSVATISDGTIMALAAGSANIVASCGSLSANCAVTVNEAGLHESLQGSDYYLVALDYISYDEIASKVIQDLRVDNANSCLYIWDSTYNAGTCSGVNAYGQYESWTSLTVASAGWSGLGCCVGVEGDYTGIDALAAVTNSPGDYYLHIAIKSSTAVSHYIKMSDIGSGSCVIGNNGAIESRNPDYDLTTNGEWQHFDIPMTHFTDQGFAFNSSHTSSINIFTVLSGGVSGTPLDYDAVFFYKK